MSAIRVVKVGGSLFDWPEMPSALNAWLSEQPAAITVLIAGGGNLVDAIREESRNRSLDEEAAHWLAIDAMSINLQLMAVLLSNAKCVSTDRDLRSVIDGGVSQNIVFDPNQFLREKECQLPGHVLPHDWSVTSDSIAARLAEVLAADELVLLKSTDPSEETTTVLAEAGFIDDYFAAFDGCGFQRRFVNLRQAAKCLAAVKI